MTREDAIKYLEKHTQYKLNGKDLVALDMAIKALEQTGWIPVSERLPEIGQYILCSLIKAKDVKHRVIICEYKREVWWSYVTAWMPLPQPYKGESEVHDANSN